jgi:hypothetical protein
MPDERGAGPERRGANSRVLEARRGPRRPSVQAAAEEETMRVRDVVVDEERRAAQRASSRQQAPADVNGCVASAPPVRQSRL